MFVVAVTERKETNESLPCSHSYLSIHHYGHGHSQYCHYGHGHGQYCQYWWHRQIVNDNDLADDSAVDAARLFEALRDICLSCPPFSNEGDEERTTDVAPRLKTR